jgi:hypothetical protein
VIRRAATMVVLVAIAGLLLYGAVYRTDSVLANQGSGSETIETRGPGSTAGGEGHGKGNGSGNRYGRATRGAGGTEGAGGSGIGGF